MRFSIVALASALSATAYAQASLDLVSVYQVLQTALPSSLIQEALTNSDAVSSQIASEFAAGQTPSWFTALPTDIQSFLIGGAAETGTPASNSATATGNSTSSATGAAGNASASVTEISGSISSRISSATGAIGSAASSGASRASSAASAGSTAGSSGMAAKPTGVIGGAMLGAAGIIGLLAL
ncbi:hypothetical protein BDZ85DRAFT_282158 [Elsinoe ampelina]|uniref:Uncharacterized protein n=1 Tax=Elsinoe ampelina TaxID=302913 RepID=A0A6A6GBM0_9PEZI|nr:hypothetical protein BDZ85DRAFT_282158 [Elsinoe ampelina]